MGPPRRTQEELHLSQAGIRNNELLRITCGEYRSAYHVLRVVSWFDLGDENFDA